MDFIRKFQEKTGKDYLSYTSIKYALEDMVLFELYTLGKLQKKSDALTFGSIYDCLLFEPEKFNDRFAVFDDASLVKEIGGGNPRATSTYKQQKAEFFKDSKGKDIVSVEDHIKAVDMISRIQETEAFEYLQGTYQQEIVGFVADAMVRGFLDCHGDGFVSDSKTTRSIKSFRKDVFVFGYDLQAYLYLQISGEKEFYWVAQDTSYPYTVAVYKATDRTLESGKRKFETGLSIIKQYVDGDQTTNKYWIFDEI